MYRGASLHQLLVTRKMSTDRLVNNWITYRVNTGGLLQQLDHNTHCQATHTCPPEPTAPLNSHFFNAPTSLTQQVRVQAPP